jgi:hypothetical protein
VAVQYTAAGILLALGAALSALNWSTVIRYWYTGRHSSPVPLFGAAFLAGGAWMLPAVRPYAWMAMFLDFGTLALLLGIPFLAREFWSTCRLNLREEYVGRRTATTVHVRLYRRNVLVVHWDFLPPPGYVGLVGMSRTGTWERLAERLILRLGEDRAVFGTEADGRTLHQLEGFSTRERDPDFSLEGMELSLQRGRTPSGEGRTGPG